MFVLQKGILSFEKFMSCIYSIDTNSMDQIQKFENSEICFSNKIILIYCLFYT